MDNNPIRGELQLRIARDPESGRSYASSQFHRGALRVLRPHYLGGSGAGVGAGDGQVSYTLINPGGAYLGGDRFEIDLHLEPGSSLNLGTQSATKIYRTPQGPAVQNTRIYLGEGAVLENLPDPVIVYREGSYVQSTLVEIEPSAMYIAAENLTPGWSPDARHFAFNKLHMRTEIRMQGRPLVVDNLRLVPSRGTSGLGIMEGFSHSGSLMVVAPELFSGDAREEQAYAQIFEVLSTVTSSLEAAVRCGISKIEGGFVLRSLAHSSEVIDLIHQEIMASARDIVGVSRVIFRGQGL